MHNGNVVSTVNGNDFENLEYDKAMEFLKRLRTPHKVEFKRYDYRFDPFNNVWLSLPALRELGVCIEDPMLAVSTLIRYLAHSITFLIAVS